MRSGVEGIVWPPMLRDRAAELAALSDYLQVSEMLPPETIAARQSEQLRSLVRHHAQHSPAFLDRLDAAGLGVDDLTDVASLRRLPVLARAEIQRGSDALFARSVPASHLPLFGRQTSGSTGQPVSVRRTRACGDLLMAMTLRDHRWFKRDFSGRMALIRPSFDQPIHSPDWGAPVNLLYSSGPALALPITTDIAEQAAFLAEFEPQVLVVYPANLAALLDQWEKKGAPPGLKHVRTIGETVSEALRLRLKALCGLNIEDGYSSEECGSIALQCPEGGQYHVMAEGLYVEVLREDGTPADAGEVGRVTITDLLNFAMPLIRYDIGDYAVAGGPCSCGRGLPTLQRVVGRERNLVRFPDGRRHWPLVGFQRFSEAAPVRQYQVIQTALDRLELRVSCDSPLSTTARKRLPEIVREALGYPFEVDLVEFRDRLPLGPNGKFEEFICRIASEDKA